MTNAKKTDPHSYYDPAQPQSRHLSLDLNVDFERKVLSGTITIELKSPSCGALDLDTKGLTIRSANDANGSAVPFSLAAQDPILGQRLRLDLPPKTAAITIDYETSPDATALQWLEPAQTEGKKQPYLFSQCQAIHARTMMPVQDSARCRVTYDARITVPAPLSAVMSAESAGVRPGRMQGTRTFLFKMPQPIPTYLMALAVGDIVSRDLGPRCRVWAEPTTIDKAAWEFSGTEDTLKRAEKLFGPYEWDRYEMIVLPPSFPYGGMENPRMSFLTPTLLAGDRSLVNVLEHEMAHSWTGNLVTNATAEHFWINEGFTIWAERRLHEELHGEDAVALQWAIGQDALDIELKRFGPDSPLTKLKTEMAGVDPDDAFSSIPYEKGARLVVLFERAVGRESWDRFVRGYIKDFHFTSITTEEFLDYLGKKFPGLAKEVKAEEWLYNPGMPSNAPVFRSKKLEELQRLAADFSKGTRPSAKEIAAWSPSEMIIYLQNLPREIDAASCDWLDKNLALTGRENYEILCDWLTIALRSDYEPSFARAREVLTRVGRMKYLRPLYLAMENHPRTRELAKSIFNAAKDGYHNLSRRVIESVMAKYPG